MSAALLAMDACLARDETVSWPYPVVACKQGLGGVPGHRTTPIVVAIVAAAGVPIPKVSSRAVSLPAGTVETMETLAPVMLEEAAMRRVVEREGGCVAWDRDDGRPAFEEALNGPDAQRAFAAALVARIAAQGATHAVIDMPIARTARVRSLADAELLEAALVEAGARLHVRVRVVHGDGGQPLSRGLGPALEARELLAVLRGEAGAAVELRERALVLASQALELCGRCRVGEGARLASAKLDDGEAWRKFVAICEAQGGMRAPPRAAFTHPVCAAWAGRIGGFESRRLATAARLAGAPRAAAAGLELHVRAGDWVRAGQPLLTLHAETAVQLGQAREFVAAEGSIVALERLQ